MITTVNNPDFAKQPTNPIDTLRTMTNNKFAQSLVIQHDQKGLSPKQMFWVDKLAKEHAMVAPVSTVDMSPISDVLEHAERHLKHPKFRLVTNTGQPVMIKILGSRSKRPGQLIVTDGGPFGDNQLFGWIKLDGAFEATKTCPREVIDLLEQIAEHPAKALHENGKRSGNCCFCNQKLTDDRSTSAGFGETCAKHWGMPWGAVSTDI